MTNLKEQIKHIVKSYKNSISGLKTVYKEEIAFRQEIVLFIIGIILLIILPLSFIIKLFLFFSLMLILISELINTAIEKTIDRISLEKHEISKKAKDIGSAIVFLSLISALFLWSFVIIKYLI